MSSGHSEDFPSFARWHIRCCLQYDPEVRISVDDALQDVFVLGGNGAWSERESPPLMPPKGSVGEDVVGPLPEVDPGQKAPVQTCTRVEISKVVAIHMNASIGDLAGIKGDGCSRRQIGPRKWVLSRRNGVRAVLPWRPVGMRNVRIGDEDARIRA